MVNPRKMTDEQKERAKRRAPVIVKKGDVKRHRYLRDHGLPHSESVASVHLPPKRRRQDDVSAIAAIVTAAIRDARKKRRRAA